MAKRQTVEGALDKNLTAKFVEDYQDDPKNPLVRRSLSRAAVSNAVYEPTALAHTNLSFSNVIETLPVTNQRSSGRCWIFAGLNILREMVVKKTGMKGQFELSQNYISLFDKIEKANFALESVLSLAQYSPNERVFMHILDNPVSDGGQWDMFVNLVMKYGVVPQDVFPETFQSNNTRQTNFLVNGAIREFAYQAHRLSSKGKKSEIRPLKEKVMEKIFHLYFNAFGVPPTRFVFEYRDGKDKFHKEVHNPKTFFDKYIGKEVLEYQSLINSPTSDKPFLKNYTIDYLGNVLEGRPINHVNVSMEDMKAAIIKQLLAGEPVWFGSDVSFYRDPETYAWDDEAFDYESAFGFSQHFDKAAMLDFRHSAMNHAMVIVGVDLEEGKPTKWKIENSWGDNVGSKGYYVMSASWFDRFVYQAVVKTKYLTRDQAAAAKKQPTHLDPWDPMGTLAD